MMPRSYLLLVLSILILSALNFSDAEVQTQNDENPLKNDQVVEPNSFFHKKDPFHKKDFFHKKDPFHKYPTIKKHPLPPIPAVVVKKHPLPPISIPVIKKKPIYVHPGIPTIPKKPVYVHPGIPKFDIPTKKPYFPPHATLP
uniref:EPI11 protein n=1 Tax=Pachyphytum oviferum TaxID=665354 RepID=Q04555_9MAGN|nr:hypothetical 16.1K protein - Pachyphytum sp [Pachyphytum sp.]AAA33848.1 EPI11 [Pachyphytum oviferum]